MSDSLFGDERRCVFLLSLEAFGNLIYLPEGARVTGVQFDQSARILKVGIEGASFGRILSEGQSPPEMVTNIVRSTVHRVTWPEGEQDSAELGPRLGQPPLTPPGDSMFPPAPAGEIVQFPASDDKESEQDPSPVTSPCESPEEE